MTKKTCKIYFSLHPLTEKVIPVKDREKYLKCKFWSANKQEADIFHAFYPGSVYGELHKIVGILSGWLIKKNDLMRAYYQLGKLIDAYRFWNADKVQRHFKRLPSFKKILDGITQDKSYPSENLIDDILEWGYGKKLISKKSLKEIKQIINNMRRDAYSDELLPIEISLEIVRLMVKHNRSVTYDDARSLLFPEINLSSELTSAVSLGQVLAISSRNKNLYYFDICSLIKWLMRKNYLSSEIVCEFQDLEIESVKESLVEYKGELNSLAKMVRSGQDRNDLLTQARDQKIILCLKYPRKYLSWRANREKIYRSKQMNYFASHRYDGLGELKISKPDDSFTCQFGGVTVDMLLFGEKPEYCTSSPLYEIEFIPTKAEYDVGLQPYIKIPAQEIGRIIVDENLIVISVVQDDNQYQNESKESSTQEERQAIPREEKVEVWENVLSELYTSSNLMQKGSRMHLVDEAISLILSAIKQLCPDFNPLAMPGTVEDFHKFCLAMPVGDKIFPKNKESFGKYCRRTISINQRKKKMPPLCGWSNPSKPDNAFWQALKPTLKSFTVNQRVFK